MSSTRKRGLFPLQLDFIARRYGVLPSELMKRDPVDLAFDLDIATLGHQAEMEEIERTRVTAGGAKHDKKAERDRIEGMIMKLPKGSAARKKWEESKRRAGGG